MVAGIGGYGNPLGVPNIGGDLYYDKNYNDNCLVTLVTLGVVREDEIFHSYAPEKADGYDLILVGKATDNSGFGGASFASLELEEEEKEKNKGAVQEPNAFLERHILKSTYALFKKIKDKKLLNKVGFKDLGAGGVACASVELADTAGYGAEIWLDNVHVGMDGLHPSVVLCSETQERFMWVCHPEITEMILDHYNKTFDMPTVSKLAQASVVGKIKNKKQYIVHSGKDVIVDAPAEMVTKGFNYNRDIKKPKLNLKEPDLKEPQNYNVVLQELLTHENICSRSSIYETYDKQVQGRTVFEPGEADAGVLAPFNNSNYPEEIRQTGIAHSTDHNPIYGKISPYWCGVNSVVESMRNVAATGATPHAITDCLCFGNPENPEQMWQFAEATKGVADACKGIRLKHNPDHTVPIIAGNVSFYNESSAGAIPPSPIVSCLGRLSDVDKAITTGFKKNNSKIMLIGDRKKELGGSLYYSLFNHLGKDLPKPSLDQVESEIWALTDLIDNRLVLSAHDISDGGVAITLSEMSFYNEIGFEVKINSAGRPDVWLFSETGGFIIELEENVLPQAQAVMSKYNIHYEEIGETTQHQAMVFGEIIHMPILKAKDSWQRSLRNKIQ